MKNVKKFKKGDIVAVEPFGDCPTHYCQIKFFKTWDIKPSPLFAMGKWYSKEGNCVSETGFDVNYIRQSTKKDLQEAILSSKNKL